MLTIQPKRRIGYPTLVRRAIAPRTRGVI